MFDRMIGKTIEILEKEVDNKKAKERLKKLFILECKYNLGLLDTTRWQNVDDEFKLEICKQLRVDAAKSVYTHLDNGYLIDILKKKISYKSESKSEQKEDSRNSSLIKRIDILKTISELPDKIKIQTRTNYNIRIRNLRKLILEILKDLDKNE
jgi:hypothetical protein|tara:strand:+ start:86 stop:544 length:459 start_codon:yes stop_codon:yes gene_type:complete